MNENSVNILSIVCVSVLLGLMLGWCLMSATTEPLICRTVKIVNGEYVRREVPCARVGADVAGNYADTDTPEPTETQWLFTATPTEFEPLPYVTMTPTEQPYPPIETTIEPTYPPYPPLDMIYWWRR